MGGLERIVVQAALAYVLGCRIWPGRANSAATRKFDGGVVSWKLWGEGVELTKAKRLNIAQIVASIERRDHWKVNSWELHW